MRHMLAIVVVLTVLCSMTNGGERSDDLLGAAPPMSCFRYEYPTTKKHQWEKPNHFENTAYWVLLARDETAFLVAQPIPDCENDNHTVGTICPFWIRTVERKGSFLALGAEHLNIVPCPDKLNKAYFQKLIREKYSNELEF